MALCLLAAAWASAARPVSAQEPDVLTVTKTPTPTTYTAAGQTIDYEYLVTNTGMAMSDYADTIVVTDDKIAAVSCPATVLAAGDSMTCTGSYVTTAADVTAGSVTNTVTVTGDVSDDNVEDTATDLATVTFVAAPAWTLSKTASPTTYAGPGETINYSYVVTNTGNVLINGISVSDDRIAVVSCPATTLAVGADMTCTATYTTTVADVAAGSVTNTATASGAPPPFSLADAVAQATVTFAAAPAWTLSKTASPTTFAAAGQTIDYTYQLTNTGNTAISGITVSDDRISPVSCPVTGLAVGAAMTCTASYVITGGDVSAGSVTNTATATGTPASGSVPDATAQATVTLLAGPAWTLSKTANPTTYTAAGQTIDYSYTLTNIGNGFITGISLSDDKVAPVTCPATTLAVGAAMTCTGSYTTTSADVSAQSVTNTATATGTPASGVLTHVTAWATVDFLGPEWTLSKTASPTTYTGAGQTINYSYVLTNTGNVNISGITLSDDKVAPVSCPASSLAAGATLTCTGSYATTAADVTAGSVTNTATASGTPAGGSLPSATAQATITFLAGPAWTLSKTASPTSYDGPGKTIGYSYTLTNTGNVAISAITLSDDKVAAVSCPASSLAAGATMTCTGSYTTTPADVTAGSVTNTATASGTPAAGTLADATATATVTLIAGPAWTLSKTADPTTYTGPGETIEYRYALTNTGNVSISAIGISDNRVASISCPATTLDPGASMTCGGSYVTTGEDVTAGSVTNTATATGTPSRGTLADVAASATVTFVAGPAWTLSKTPDPGDFAASGQLIRYSYRLTNTGNVRITGIAVTDDRVTTVACPGSVLDPGESFTCTGVYTTTDADVTAGTIANIATATGTPAAGTLAGVTAAATIRFTAGPAWTLTKTADPTTYTAAGQTIQYTYTLTNLGNVGISAISLTDDRVAPVECPATTLALGASFTCTGSHTTTADDLAARSITNTAEATGTPAAGTLPRATASATVTFDAAGHVEETTRVVRTFLLRRLQLLTQGPDRARLIRRLRRFAGAGGPSGANAQDAVTVSGNAVALATAFGLATSTRQLAEAREAGVTGGGTGPVWLAGGQSTRRRPAARRDPYRGWDLWTEVHFDVMRAPAARSEFGIAYVGLDYLASQSTLLGVLVQYDWTKEEASGRGRTAEGHGLMAGPYLSARMGQHMFLDLRAALGTSTNEINPIGAGWDTFRTARLLTQVRVMGNASPKSVQIRPAVALDYLVERQKRYTDTLGFDIPDQTISLGQLTFGPEIARRFDTAGGASYEPFASVHGVWTFEGTDVDAPLVLAGPGHTLRGRTEGGLEYRSRRGLSLTVMGAYDGIGLTDVEDLGFRVWVTFPLN